LGSFGSNCSKFIATMHKFTAEFSIKY